MEIKLYFSSVDKTFPFPTVCGINEIFDECSTACPRTCMNPHQNSSCDTCVPRCQCVEDFLRDSDGTCVKPNECSQLKTLP